MVRVDDLGGQEGQHQSGQEDRDVAHSDVCRGSSVMSKLLYQAVLDGEISRIPRHLASWTITDET